MLRIFWVKLYCFYFLSFFKFDHLASLDKLEKFFSCSKKNSILIDYIKKDKNLSSTNKKRRLQVHRATRWHSCFAAVESFIVLFEPINGIFGNFK